MLESGPDFPVCQCAIHQQRQFCAFYPDFRFSRICWCKTSACKQFLLACQCQSDLLQRLKTLNTRLLMEMSLFFKNWFPNTGGISLLCTASCYCRIDRNSSLTVHCCRSSPTPTGSRPPMPLRQDSRRMQYDAKVFFCNIILDIQIYSVIHCC